MGALNRHTRLAFMAGGIISLLALLLLVVFFSDTEGGLWKILVVVGVVFIFAVLLIRQMVQRFIYERIRLIYKTIHRLKVPKNAGRSQYTSDMLEQVNREVEEWAARQGKEIDALKRLEAYRRDFIGNVSHELKTPLFNIQGYILTLLDGGLEDENINREYLMRTEKSVERLIAIVKDLDTISGLEAGGLKMEFSRFDIVTLAKDVMEFLEIKAKKRRVRVYFRDTYEKPIFVNGDKDRIRQVLINLIDNSLRYSNPTEEARTKISFFDMDEHILIEVSDNGIGIEESELSRVFERFYRTDKGRSREQKGSGLGLAIVKHILEAHEQTIHVRSSVGIGTTFGFTLKKG
jgi:two-component system, OmpR family, phosphate regulon sensor histidine kinase PhoR